MDAKRKRRVKKGCPNPLFVKWLQEWKDEAIENGWKSSYTYNKALNSIKRYPLPLNSGQEAKVLENIGDKVAKMLDKKLSEYITSGGSLENLHQEPSNTPSSSKVAPLSPINSSPLANLHTSSSTGMNPGSQHSSTGMSPCSQNRKRQSGNENTDCTTRKRQRATKQYVPAYRSSTYAVLIALLKAEQSDGFKGYMLKQELIAAAQPLCDSSFTIPKDGGYYTAWSSTTNMFKRNLITKSSHPPRYSLADEGVSLATRLIDVHMTTFTSSPPPTTDIALPGNRKDDHSSISPEIYAATRRPNKKQEPIKDSTTGTRSVQLTSSKYTDTICIDSSPVKSTITKSYDTNSNTQDNEISITDHSDEEMEVLPLIDKLCYTTSSPSPFPLPPLTPPTNFVTLFTDGKISPPELPQTDYEPRVTSEDLLTKSSCTFKSKSPHHFASSKSKSSYKSDTICINSSPVKSYSIKTKSTTSSSVNLVDSDDEDIEILPLAQRMGLVNRTVQSSCVPTLSNSEMSLTTESSIGGVQVISDKPTLSSVPSLSRVIPSVSVNRTCQDKCAQSSQQSTMVNMNNPLFTLKPGEFDVVLCIDNTESTANRKSTSHFRGLLLEELNKNGVKFSVRKLSVGDFIWIAQERVGASKGRLRLPESREVVLEYIVERKRMDDLAGSIIDRRFQEQKFRMKHSGVYNPVYLVEEFGDIGHCKLPESSLHQAVTNTQIIDGFYVKQTKDIRESIAYLTIMTRFLQQQYSMSTIQSHPIETILLFNKQRKEGTIVADKELVYGLPFDIFNESSVKTKVSSVSEMFGRSLIQIPKSSVERAFALLEVYPTVAHLREGYRKCLTEKERENMLSSLRAGDCKRRFGLALSCMLYELYWKGN